MSLNNTTIPGICCGQLYAIRKSNKTFLSGADAIALMTAGLMMDRGEYNRILEQIVEDGRNQPPENDKPGKNILIIGPLVDNIGLLEQIESLGANIVDDDITNGFRYVGRDVRTQGDVYENLAERYLCSAPSPTLYTDPKHELQAFGDRMAGLS